MTNKAQVNKTEGDVGFFRSGIIRFNSGCKQFYIFLLSHIKIVKWGLLSISLLFAISKTVFYHGFNVDSYQFFAQAIETYILTGKKTEVFLYFHGRHRFFYPLLIALVHIILPIDISLLAAVMSLFSLIGTIILMKKILLLLNFQEQVIALSQIFVIMSYNYLNYWFNILTDTVGLFFFLIFIYFLMRSNQQKQLKYLLFSFLFLIMAIFTREVYLFGIILYILLIKNHFVQIGLLGGTSISLLLIMIFFPEKLTFMDHFLAGYQYYDLYLNGRVFELFWSMQTRWGNWEYISAFLKGLFKVGIIPSCIITIGFIILYKRSLICKKETSEKTKKIETILKSKSTILIVWFIIYFLIYGLFYSNQSSATGLRYWLPISWIPCIWCAHFIADSKFADYHIWKVGAIFFLITVPIGWSAAEIYMNRYHPSGTGSLLHQDRYFTNFTHSGMIPEYSHTDFSVEITEDAFLSIELSDTKYLNTSHSIILNFKTWVYVNEMLEIDMRLAANPNISHISFECYDTLPEYRPLCGNLALNQTLANYTTAFQIFHFQYDAMMQLKCFKLVISGNTGALIILDYITIQSN